MYLQMNIYVLLMKYDKILSVFWLFMDMIPENTEIMDEEHGSYKK